MRSVGESGGLVVWVGRGYSGMLWTLYARPTALGLVVILIH